MMNAEQNMDLILNTFIALLVKAGLKAQIKRMMSMEDEKPFTREYVLGASASVDEMLVDMGLTKEYDKIESRFKKMLKEEIAEGKTAKQLFAKYDKGDTLLKIVLKIMADIVSEAEAKHEDTATKAKA